MSADIDWQELVLASPWAAEVGDANISFGLPATEEQIRLVENVIQTQMPAELRSLLAVANGVANDSDRCLVLSAEQIVNETETNFRNPESPYMEGIYTDTFHEGPQPVDKFCLLSNALGNGDYYAICLSPVEDFQPGDVIHWNHETNERTLVAKDLREFISDQNPGIR